MAPAQAKTAAINFIRGSKQAKGIPDATEENIEEIQILEDESSIPVMYFINLKENSGFVVLSAYIGERPILAYADEGSFDMEKVADYEGVNDWVLTKYLKITGMRNLEIPPSNDALNQWNALGGAIGGIGLMDNDGNPIHWDPPVLVSEDTETHGPLLEDIAWRQRNGTSTTYVMYNNTVRYNNCTAGTAPTNCVTVSIRKIMKYHNHPNIYNIATIYPYIDYNTPYAYNTQPAFDIASFLGNIGANVQMQYSCNGSGAKSQNAMMAFNNAYHYTTDALSNIDLNTIKADVINGKPVYLDGYREMKVVITQTPRKFIGRMTIGRTKTKTVYDEGHAWVADGYEKITGYYHNPNNNTYFYAKISDHVHMNWGWGRHSFNGWYDYDTWTDIDGLIINSVQFIYNQHMISNITPN